MIPWSEVWTRIVPAKDWTDTCWSVSRCPPSLGTISWLAAPGKYTHLLLLQEPLASVLGNKSLEKRFRSLTDCCMDKLKIWSFIRSYLIIEQHSSFSKGSKKPIPHIADLHFHMVFSDFDQKWRDLWIRKNHRVVPMSPTHLGPPEARPGQHVQNPPWAPVAAGFGATSERYVRTFFPVQSFWIVGGYHCTSAELWPIAFGQSRVLILNRKQNNWMIFHLSLSKALAISGIRAWCLCRSSMPLL